MKLFFTFLLLGFLILSNAQTIYYVNSESYQWNEEIHTLVYDDLQLAINESSIGDEIRIAQGVIILGETIILNEDKIVKGGYDVTTNLQTASSTLDGNNLIRVIRTQGLSNAAIIDHLVITNGFVEDELNGDVEGGGMLNLYSSPTISYVDFISNRASSFGGGMYNAYSNPVINNVTFDNNYAFEGGGLYNIYSSPILTNVNLLSNFAESGGAGIDITFGDLILTNVKFELNTAGGGAHSSSGAGLQSNVANLILENVSFISNRASYGTGMVIEEGSAILNKVSFLSNSNMDELGGASLHTHGVDPLTLTDVSFISNLGGGFSNVYSEDLILTNVSFALNHSNLSGAGLKLHNTEKTTLTNVSFVSNTTGDEGAGIYSFRSPISVSNTIFYNNLAGSNISDIDVNILNTLPYLEENSSNNASDSDGANIDASIGFINLEDIDVDNLFTNINDLAGADNVIGTYDDGLVPKIGAIIINAGDDTKNNTSFDLAGQIRKIESIDIGAYEYQGPLNILDFENHGKVLVYPNPNNGTFNIELGVETLKSITIFNEAGQFVYSDDFMHDKTQFRINLLTGVYTLKLTLSNGKVINKKIIVK